MDENNLKLLLKVKSSLRQSEGETLIKWHKFTFAFAVNVNKSH